MFPEVSVCCILSKFYIKPQQQNTKPERKPSCILSKFYIKPQQMDELESKAMVVSYRNSTSNHNGRHGHGGQRIVVSYRNSTSNHNSGSRFSSATRVVSYRNSTSNHNKDRGCFLYFGLYLIEILHQTTTVPERGGRKVFERTCNAFGLVAGAKIKRDFQIRNST